MPGTSLPSTRASEPHGPRHTHRTQPLRQAKLCPQWPLLLTLSFSFQGQLVTKDYPPYALAIIGLLVAASIMCIPLVALGTFVTRCLKRGDTPPVA